MIRTPRLLLRDWRDDDLEPFAAMSADPEVMAHYPALLTRERAEAAVVRIRDHLANEGYGFWAIEVIDGPPFIGFCGLARVRFEAPFAPAVEVGWRLARGHWGQGYASEAGRAAVDYGHGALGLDEIVAFLLPANRRSANVCCRIGMHRDPEGDFDHPQIPEGTISVGGFPQRRHVLYRVTRGQNASAPKVRPSDC